MVTDATSAETLTGLHILLVEDEYMIADEMTRALQSLGSTVVGPAPSMDDALRLLDEARIDIAILDVNLDGEPVWPLADALNARAMPFIFTTGYDRSAFPARHADAPHCEKPVDLLSLKAALLRLR